MLLYRRILALLFAFSWAQYATAQLPQVADSRLGVDLVQLADGSRLYGFVLDLTPDGGLTIAIEREWLKGQYPKLHEKFELLAETEAKAAHAEMIIRLEEWLKERPEPGPLQRFLTLHLKEARELEVERDTDKLFCLVTLTKAETRKVAIQAPERRHVAGIAYQHRLKDIVITPASALSKRLIDIDVKAEAEQVDLTNELPSVVRQSERQWAARRALVEFNMREPLEYQGTGTTLIRTGEEANAMALIGQMLGGSGGDAISQLGAELGLPEFAKPKEAQDWWKKTTQAAERHGFHGVLITRLEQNVLAVDVSVEASFFARLSPGEWFRVATFKAQSSANEQVAERMEQLKQDPQIQSVLSTLQSLGLAANEQLDQALRHGAATQVALADVHAAWYKFQQQHTESLSGPPVPIEK
jgi:hypothetical protein